VPIRAPGGKRFRLQEERNMRKLVKLLAAAAGAVTVAALVMAPAMADPINLNTGKFVEPRPCDIVGAGSNTTEYVLDQLSVNYNKPIVKAHPGSQTASCKKFPKPFLYSWDALQNAAATSSPVIKFKSGCTGEERPNGSSPGIADLAAGAGGTTGGHPCLDFARSARAPKSTDPTNLSFIAFGLDNVTYATIGKSKKFPKGSNAPANLSTTDLHNIYSCTATTWNQVGGTSHAKIKPLLPQSGSGTVSFFLAAIGVVTPGPCVNEPTTLEENQGVAPIFRFKAAPNYLIPYSAGKWVAQEYHSPPCAHSTCPSDPTGVFIKCKKPKPVQNEFGCAENGVLKLNDINGTDPLKGRALNPPASASNPKGFTAAFVRSLFNVVRGTKTIPGYLAPIFGPAGFVCSAGQRATIQDYGFEPAHVAGFPTCGSITPG
jgi:ABC-type phosphate transport system substrate-binding protein